MPRTGIGDENDNSSYCSLSHARPTSRILKILWITLAVLSYLCLTYQPDLGWWVSLAGTACICLFSRLAWGSRWVSWTGLAISKSGTGLSLLLLLVCLACSYLLIGWASRSAGLDVTSIYGHSSWPARLLHTVGQTINEEIVLGALLLNGCAVWFKRGRLLVISVAVAVCFAFLHLAFYGCRPEDTVNYGILTLPTLVAIVGVGVLRNNLILSSRHIGYAWAVHLGWNAIFFGNYFTRSGTYLDEPQHFNTLLGTWLNIVVISLAVLVSVYLGRNRLLAARGNNAA